MAKHEIDRSIDEAIGFNSKPPDFLHSGINLMTSIQDSSAEINNIGQKCVCVQVPCAVDSGACAHVAPANIFCMLGSVEANIDLDRISGVRAVAAARLNWGSHAPNSDSIPPILTTSPQLDASTHSMYRHSRGSDKLSAATNLQHRHTHNINT